MAILTRKAMLHTYSGTTVFPSGLTFLSIEAQIYWFHTAFRAQCGKRKDLA
jgi:hypothetical protein